MGSVQHRATKALWTKMYLGDSQTSRISILMALGESAAAFLFLGGRWRSGSLGPYHQPTWIRKITTLCWKVIYIDGKAISVSMFVDESNPPDHNLFKIAESRQCPRLSDATRSSASWARGRGDGAIISCLVVETLVWKMGTHLGSTVIQNHSSQCQPTISGWKGWKPCNLQRRSSHV